MNDSLVGFYRRKSIPSAVHVLHFSDAGNVVKVEVYSSV